MKWYDWVWSWLSVIVLLGILVSFYITFNYYWQIAGLCLFIGVHSGKAQQKLSDYYKQNVKR